MKTIEKINRACKEYEKLSGKTCVAIHKHRVTMDCFLRRKSSHLFKIDIDGKMVSGRIWDFDSYNSPIDEGDFWDRIEQDFFVAGLLNMEKP